MPFTIKAVYMRRHGACELNVDETITYDGLQSAMLSELGIGGGDRHVHEHGHGHGDRHADGDGDGNGDDAGNKLCMFYVNCENDFVRIANTDDLKFDFFLSFSFFLSFFF
jgi:hypothetical protein